MVPGWAPLAGTAGQVPGLEKILEGAPMRAGLLHACATSTSGHVQEPRVGMLQCGNQLQHHSCNV